MADQERDHRDIVGGLVLTAVGALAAVYAGTNYSLGTLQRMGPGMVPVMLGCLLAGLGLLIVLPALFRAGPAMADRFEWRPLVMVTLAVAIFAVTIERVGLLLAVILMTLCAAMADSKLGPVGALALGAVLAVIAIGVFVFGLSMPMRIVSWSW